MSRSRGLEAGVLLLAVPILFYGLGSYSLVNGDEGIYHYMARRMLESGNWLRLEFTGQERVYDTFTHAPLFLWAKAVVISVLGDSWWSMRILSAALGWLSIAATFRLVDSVTGRPGAALAAALVQLTSFQFVYLHCARTGEMEPALTLAFPLAAYFFLQAVRGERSFVAHHLCLIALMNMKLAIVAIPVLAEAAFFALYPALRPRLRDWIHAGIWLFPLGLSWHAVQVVVHWSSLPDVARELLGQSGASRFRHDVGFAGRVAYYARHLAFGTLPWTIVFPVAFVVIARRAHERPGDDFERTSWALLSLFAAAVVAFFLAIAIHHPWYWMPAIPFLSAFTGAAIHQWTTERPGRIVRVALACGAAAAIWIDWPVAGFNPFAERAAHATPELVWRQLAGGPWIGVPIAALLLTLALEGLARLPSPAWLGATVAAGLFGLASVRTVAPLQFVDHRSEMDRLHGLLDEARTSGRPLPQPLIVGEAGMLKARYYFGDDYTIRRLPEWRRARGEFYRLEARPNSQNPSPRLTAP